VASIAAAHEGTLELSTPPTGSGLAVTLRLPPAEHEPAGSGGAPGPPAA